MKKIYSCLGMMFLITAHGLALSFTSTTSGNWDNPATWGLTGTPTVGVNFPGASDNVTISASNTVSLAVDAACNNLTINITGGLLQVSNFTLTINGTLAQNSVGSSGNVITTGASGIVKFVGSTRALFGTWEATNINWRCEVALTSGQTGSCGSANKYGYLKITSGTYTNSGELRIDSTGGDGFGVIDIATGATLIVQSKIGNRVATTTIPSFCRFINIDGTLEMSNSTSGMIINGQNIFVNSGGTLRLRRGGVSNGGGGTTPISSVPSGVFNFIYAPGSLLEYINNYTNSLSSNFIQTGAELSQANISGGTAGASIYNISVDALNINNNDIQLAVTPQVFGTVTIKKGFLVAIAGSVLAYQSGSTLKYNSSLAQIATGTSPFSTNLVSFPTQLGSGPTNLTIDNTAGVTFNDDGDIHLLPGTLTFTNGKITANNSLHPLILTETANIVGANAAGGKYINGIFQKITNSTAAFVFPVGTASTAHFFTLQPGTTSISTWQAQYFNANPITDVGGSFQSPISGITNSEYWDIQRISGSSSAKVTFTWSSPISGASVTDYIRVAHWSGSAWEDYGSDGIFTFGNSSSGSVTSDLKSNFSPLTIGFAPATALPVKLISFSVVKQGTGAAIAWKVADPQDAKRYEIYKSGDGQNYQLLQTIAGDPNKENFTALDSKLLDGTNYYRLKVFDIDGSFYYSKIVVIFNKNSGIEIVGLSPTLIYNSANLNVTSSNRTQINIMVSDVQGRIIQRMSKDVMTGENSINLNFSTLPSGTYQLTTSTADGSLKTIRFMKL